MSHLNAFVALVTTDDANCHHGFRNLDQANDGSVLRTKVRTCNQGLNEYHFGGIEFHGLITNLLARYIRA